jgi:hypothetical protein
MSDMPPAQGPAHGPNTKVVLLAPELFPNPLNHGALLATLKQRETNVRLLVRLANPPAEAQAGVPADLSAIQALADAGIKVEILASANVAVPPTPLHVVQMPAGTSDEDTNALALALSDSVLVDAAPNLIELARALNKPFVRPGESLPPIIGTDESLTSGLDPEDLPWSHRPGRFIWGRLEQCLLELAAFNWHGIIKSAQAFSGCIFTLSMPCGPSFPRESEDTETNDDDWRHKIPDQAARDTNAAIVARFDRLDRSATYGAYKHRDIAWIAYMLAVLAVFLAVGGSLHLQTEHEHGAQPCRCEAGMPGAPVAPPHVESTHSVAAVEASPSGPADGQRALAGEKQDAWDSVWAFGRGSIQNHPGSWVELGVLAMILTMTLWSTAKKLQDRWTACRFGAEQLRIARTCLPLLVLPKALSTLDEPAAKDPFQQALAEVKRAVRNQGLPRRLPDFSSLTAVKWLEFIVAGQIGYHRNNHKKLDCAERRLKAIGTLAFAAALVAVIAHILGCSWAGLLYLTAGLPALAAAVHGVTTRLGFVHRLHLSQDAEAELERINNGLRHLSTQAAPSMSTVRGLAHDAAEAMAAENRSWHNLVRRQRDELP